MQAVRHLADQLRSADRLRLAVRLRQLHSVGRDSAARRSAAALAHRLLRGRGSDPFRWWAIALRLDSQVADLDLVAAGSGMAADMAGAADAGAAALAGADSDLDGDLAGESVGDGIHGIGIRGGDGAVCGDLVMGTTLLGLDIIPIRLRTTPLHRILRLTVPAIRETATTTLRRTRMPILIPARTTIRRA
jgi:hypothetical protein